MLSFVHNSDRMVYLFSLVLVVIVAKVNFYFILTHLGWSGSVDLLPESVLLFKVSSSILSEININLSGLT